MAEGDVNNVVEKSKELFNLLWPNLLQPTKGGCHGYLTVAEFCSVESTECI